ncbi:MAG TPA: hypothetical protein VGF76_14395 [Polyangiaceae bacterium]
MRGGLGVIQVGLLALGLLLLCCLAVAMRVPAAKPAPRRAESRPEPAEAAIPDEHITRLYGLPSKPIESGDSCGLLDFASQPDEPLEHRSDSRVVVSYEDEAEGGRNHLATCAHFALRKRRQ